MSHKMAAGTAAVALALIVLTLGFPANDARAKAVELTDAQMGQITAGAWSWSGAMGDFNLIDVNGHHYVGTAGSPNYTETETGVTWTLGSEMIYYGDLIAIGVLVSDTQRWDGGISTGPHPK